MNNFADDPTMPDAPRPPCTPCGEDPSSLPDAADATEMTDDATREARARRTRWIERALAYLDLLLWGLMAGRLVDPLFLDGQLLPSMAGAFLPGAVLHALGYRSLSVHRFGFAAGLIVFMIWDGRLDPMQVAHTLQQGRYVVPALLCIAVIPLANAARWHLLLRGQGITMRRRDALRHVLVGLFFNQFIPGASGGDVYRIYVAGAAPGGTGSKAFTTVLLDRFLGLPPLFAIVLGAYAINGAAFSQNAQLRQFSVPILVVCAVSALFFVYLTIGSAYVIRWTRWLTRKVPAFRFLLRIHEAVGAYRKTPGVLVWAFFLGLAMHGATVMTCVFFGWAAGIRSVPLSQFFFLVPLGMSVNYLPLAPGGIGQGENAFSYLFSAAAPGVEIAGMAVAMMLGFRIAMLLVSLVGGLWYMIGRRSTSAHRIDEDGIVSEHKEAAAPERSAAPPAMSPDTPPEEAASLS